MAAGQYVLFGSLLVAGLFLCGAIHTSPSLASEDTSGTAEDSHSGGDMTAKATANTGLRGTSQQKSPSLATEDTSGTATARLEAARDRARSLGQLTGDWEGVRKQLLFAAGLADIPGTTSHCFDDFNHVSATTMLDLTQDNKHDGGVKGMAIGNDLGSGIRSASLHDAKGFEENGSWCTCALGAGDEPPHDIAHHQFRSKVAFYLVWLNGGDKFALATEEGEKLACGQPTGDIPPEGGVQEGRKGNWDIFTEKGEGKIAKAALECGSAGPATGPKSAGQSGSLLGLSALAASFVLAF